MRYRTLGKTGIEVSEIGFGAWGIGGDWGGADDAAAVAALERAFDLGINFYDTAHVYGDGHSERLIGQTFRTRRDRVIIASKIPPQTYRWPVTETDSILDTFSAEWIVKCTEESLRRLHTDYIDVQQLHAWTPLYTEVDEWYDALLKLKADGKIRAFGVSANDWDPYGAVDLVNSGRVDTVQVIYNIFEQRPAERLFPAAREQNVGIIARVPFEEGLLTGTIRPGHEFPEGDWRAGWLTPDRLEEAARRVDALRPYLAEDRPTLAALALKFCLHPDEVSTVIPGMRRPEHVEANAAVTDTAPLPDDVVAALRDHAFVHGWAYPWSEPELVTVATYSQTALAHLAQARLQAAGIESFIENVLSADLIPTVASDIAVPLRVREVDAERAREVLDQEPLPDTAEPDASEEVSET